MLWNRNRNRRNRTFCLGGTGIRMHYGSGTGFGSGSNIKWNKKSQIKNERTTFREIILIMKLKRQDFVQTFCCWKTVLDIVWIRNRNRNQNYSKVGTRTTTNHYGSTTLLRNLTGAGYKQEKINLSSVSGWNLPTVIIIIFLNKTLNDVKSPSTIFKLPCIMHRKNS